MEEEYTGIVIRTIHFNESSEIVHVLTNQGIISVMVKGARRYKSHKLSFCIPMTKVSFKVTSSKISSLIDYTILNDYSIIKEDLKKNLWFSYILEIVNKLPDNSYYRNIYNLIDKIFELGSFNNPMLLIMIAQTKLLKIYGVEPELKKCVICGKPNLDFFSISNGGFVCNNCSANDKTNAKPYLDIRTLYYFDIYNGNLNDLSNIDLKDVFLNLKAYYDYYVDI
ncbi:MAG: DNA repair protein RecO, partial [Acholeplasmatales bacterium]|nr:DNA repair protein RecO [Acholeplasmatales bacterium]